MTLMLWPTVSTSLGFSFLAFGLILGVLALTLDLHWGDVTAEALIERLVVAVVLMVSGLAAGLPFIILGQIARTLLDQKALLQRIDGHLQASSRLSSEIPRAS